MVTPPFGGASLTCRAVDAKRDAVAHAVAEHGISERRACVILQVDRSMVAIDPSAVLTMTYEWRYAELPLNGGALVIDVSKSCWNERVSL